MTIARGQPRTSAYSPAPASGYHADMTRTVAISAPAGWQGEIYDLVAAGQAAGVVAARPGADAGKVCATARDLIEGATEGTSRAVWA